MLLVKHLHSITFIRSELLILCSVKCFIEYVTLIFKFALKNAFCSHELLPMLLSHAFFCTAESYAIETAILKSRGVLCSMF